MALSSDQAANNEPVRRRGRPPKVPDRRDEVLRTAARIFSQCGFKNATLEDVGNALGISRPALYHYAKSKDELLSECAKIAFQELLDALDTAKAAPNGLERVQVFFRLYGNIIWDDFGRCFVLTDRRELNDLEKEHTRQTQLMLGAAVESLVLEGIKDGSIRQCPAADVSRTLFGVFNSIPRWHHEHSRRPIADISESLLTIVVQGIAGLRT